MSTRQYNRGYDEGAEKRTYENPLEDPVDPSGRASE